MRIAFLGHSYHRTTASSRFMQAILERLGDVECFYDESWNGGPAVDVPALMRAGYDAIHVWQMEALLEAVVAARPTVPVVWYPMYDSCRHATPEFWARIAPAARMVSFCREVHEQAVRKGLDSAWFQYFPDPALHAPAAPTGEGIFFWPRRSEFGWEGFKRLLPEGFQGRIHIHTHPDPGTEPPDLPSEADQARHGVTVSGWFEDRGALDRLVGSFPVYVAPRLHEGIGMAFLEALARGQCVVAADVPTMNEYITHGVNGLLFAPDRKRPLDLAQAAALGARARELVALGHARWRREAEGRLLDVLAAPVGAPLRSLAEPFPA